MRTRRRAPAATGQSLWLLTYSDLVTLIFTFFVLFIAASSIDEKAKIAAVNSLSTSFASGKNSAQEHRPLTPSPPRPGGETQANNSIARNPESPFQNNAVAGNIENDLSPARSLIFEENGVDLDFQENKHLQVLSVGADALFRPGSSALSTDGITLLDKVLPYLRDLEYPLLVAGHASPRRDEEGKNYTVDIENRDMDSTWSLSFQRALAVYRRLTERGIDPGRLSLEAFGSFHPRFSDNTPEGRRKNRRVDLVLDKRNLEWIKKIDALKNREGTRTEMYYNGFKFDLSLPKPSPQPVRP
ncbi:MAG: OmpA family protein [Desulfovibrio sp.]|nr:OmpA family protein [Desulfovibrio sp.]